MGSLFLLSVLPFLLSSTSLTLSYITLPSLRIHPLSLALSLSRSTLLVSDESCDQPLSPPPRSPETNHTPTEGRFTNTQQPSLSLVIIAALSAAGERERKIEEENKREDEGERSPGERLRGGQEGEENIQPAEEEEGGGVSREEEGEVLPE